MGRCRKDLRGSHQRRDVLESRTLSAFVSRCTLTGASLQCIPHYSLYGMGIAYCAAHPAMTSRRAAGPAVCTSARSFRGQHIYVGDGNYRSSW